MCNQFIIWMLTSDIIYLRDNTVKAFTTLVQRNRNFIQVRNADFSSINVSVETNPPFFFTGNF